MSRSDKIQVLVVVLAVAAVLYRVATAEPGDKSATCEQNGGTEVEEGVCVIQAAPDPRASELIEQLEENQQ